MVQSESGIIFVYQNIVMKYLATIVIAVLVGLHWHCEWGWLLVAVTATFIINLLKDREYEQSRKTQK